MFPELQAHLKERFNLLQGDWVNKNNAYEPEICDVLEMRHEASKYWDARWKEHLIEFKKGKSIWIDLVRYADVVLRTNSDACNKTITLFFIPNVWRKAIEEVLCVETEALISKMGLTENDWKALLAISLRIPRALNAQSRLTIPDVKRLQCFSVK